MKRQRTYGLYRQNIARCAILIGAAGLWSFLDAQNTASAVAAPTEIRVTEGRGLPEALDQVQQKFLKPITYEEAPFESPTDLGRVTVQGKAGPRQLFVNPQALFTVTLGTVDSTPYYASQTVLSAYQNAGGRGVYKVVLQQSDRVDVVPVQVLGTGGSMREITPVMSRPLTFPNATRSLPQTVTLITDALSKVSGFKVIPMSLPGEPLTAVTLGANGESAADVIEKLGQAINSPVSFQCLFEPNEKAYYLNLKTVAPPSVAGGPALHGRRKNPKTGPSNSPFFTKTQ
jgi:hypothetical protein